MLEHIKIKVDEKKWEGHPRITVAGKAGLPEAAKVTPEMLKIRDSRIGIPVLDKGGGFNRDITVDNIRQYVMGIGDTNPLFLNEEYAKKTKYGSIIAPGTFFFSTGGGGYGGAVGGSKEEEEARRKREEERRKRGGVGGALSGIHGWYSGGEWEWWRPLYAGTKLWAVGVVRPMVIKKGRMAGGGNIYIDYHDAIQVHADTRELIGKQLSYSVKAERDEAKGAGKEREKSGYTKPVYTKEDWLKILELYDTEEVRGAEPRYWEDVQIGDKVGPMIKGPLSVRDMTAYIMGAGGPFLGRAHKIEFMYERAHPRVLDYVEEIGEADVPELVHIFDAYARNIGVERAYDYGMQRMGWLCNLFTNWMGDDGFLWKMTGDERAFNQIGDITFFEGKVTNKYIDEGKCCVDIEAWAKNQRDMWSMVPKTSTVILPSKEHGAVVYPDPASKLVEEVKAARPLHELIREGLL
ncbi:MaoC family dehydratase N-terminal domain-containing protein [Chloroflexota bacterium]